MSVFQIFDSPGVELKLNGIRYFGAAVMVLAAMLAGSCSEETAAGGGGVLIPDGSIGGEPRQMTVAQPLEAVALDSEPINRGGQERIYVGNRDMFRMHGALSFRVRQVESTDPPGLPADAIIGSATLRLFIVSYENYNPGVPLDVDVLLLDQDFEELETTWEDASDGVAWSTPGAANGQVVGAFQFSGEELDDVSIDTMVVVLDSATVNQYLQNGRTSLPLSLIPADQDAWFSMFGREIDPDAAVASQIDLVYRLSGSTTNSALERRAKGDATLSTYSGTIDPGMLTVGAEPTSQVLFRYDLSQLPRDATINKALLHVSVFDIAYVDTFQVITFANDEKEFVTPELTSLSVSQGIGEDTDTLALDVTLSLQRILALDSTGTNYYMALGSNTLVNVGGYVQFYPPDWDEQARRPLLELIYTDAPDNAKP